LMSTHFLLGMYTGDYDGALTIFRDVTKHPRFDVGLNSDRRETWKIYEGYLQYVVKCHWLTLPADNSMGLRKVFRLQTFLNGFRAVRHDKQGENLAVLILQAVWLFETRQLEKLRSLRHSLKSYSDRHLRIAGSRRGLLFVKLILLMIDLDFNAAAMKARGAKSYNALCDPGSERTIAVEGVEVLPYDKLWGHILERLKSRER
jgi:hypothetical protein